MVNTYELFRFKKNNFYYIVYNKSIQVLLLTFFFVLSGDTDAVVRLVCKNNKNPISETKTDTKGYFMLLAPKTVTNYDIKNCRAFLVKSPDAKCSKVSTFNGGYKGSVLKPVLKPGFSSVIIKKFKYGVYNVGPFAFESTCPK